MAEVHTVIERQAVVQQANLIVDPAALGIRFLSAQEGRRIILAITRQAATKWNTDAGGEAVIAKAGAWIGRI